MLLVVKPQVSNNLLAEFQHDAVRNFFMIIISGVNGDIGRKKIQPAFVLNRKLQKDCLSAEEIDINGSKSKCIPLVPYALNNNMSCIDYRTDFISKEV
jgi:hypothetical protein